MRRLIVSLAIALVASRAAAAIHTGGNQFKPYQTMTYPGDTNSGFVINEDVYLDTHSNLAEAVLANVGNAAGLHERFLVDQTFTNIGSQNLLEWGGFVPGSVAPGTLGFLIEGNSVAIYKNGRLLTPDVDYYLAFERPIQEPLWQSDWHSFGFSFPAGKVIRSGDQLRFTFKVFKAGGDGIWHQGEGVPFTQGAENTPEPSMLATAFGFVGFLASRRPRRRWAC